MFRVRWDLTALGAVLALLLPAALAHAQCNPTTDPDKTDIANARAAIEANCDCAGALSVASNRPAVPRAEHVFRAGVRDGRSVSVVDPDEPNAPPDRYSAYGFARFRPRFRPRRGFCVER